MALPLQECSSNLTSHSRKRAGQLVKSWTSTTGRRGVRTIIQAALPIERSTDSAGRRRVPITIRPALNIRVPFYTHPL